MSWVADLVEDGAASDRDLIVGIDPGRDGGVAVLSKAGELVDAIRIEWATISPTHWLMSKTKRLWPRVAFLAVEEPIAYKGKDALTSSMMKVALQSGVWIGIARAGGVEETRIILVRPQTWQAKVIGPLRRGMPTKAASKETARRLVGAAHERIRLRNDSIHDGLADAVCIAEYGRAQFVRSLVLAAG